MKRTGLVLLAVAAVAIAGCDGKKDDENWKVGYSLGYKLGERVQKEVKDLDVNGFIAGFKDAYAGEKEPKLTEEQMGETIKGYQERRVAQMREEMKQKSDKNLADATAFLAENGKKTNVKTLPSGLQYEVIAEGTGASPKATDIVKARYHGTLMDGTVFDSTRERGDEPAEFPLNRVIPAWTEGVQLMKKGGKIKLFVPPALGYGERGAGGKIGPNSLLIFEIELVDFYDPAKPPKK